MTIESALYSRLSTEATDLYALVAARVYPVRFPQNPTFPCVTWQRIFAGRENAMGSDAPPVRVRIQVDGWAETFDGVRSLAEALRERLQRWRLSGADTVQDTFLISEHDEYDDEAEIYRVMFEIELIYDEA